MVKVVDPTPAGGFTWVNGAMKNAPALAVADRERIWLGSIVPERDTPPTHAGTILENQRAESVGEEGIRVVSTGYMVHNSRSAYWSNSDVPSCSQI
eukprot:4179581-Amphidinium_carterae.1